MPTDLLDPVLDTTRALAVLQARLHTSGLNEEQQRRRAQMVHELESRAPDVALIIEAWMEAGANAWLEVRPPHEVWLHAPACVGRRHWRVGPDTIRALRPALKI